MRSLGIDPESVGSIDDSVSTVSMSGFGASGPADDQVSWGPILDASSGVASTTGYADSGPYKQGLAFPDPVGGLHAALAALVAIWDQRRTGVASHIDLSQLETLLGVAGDAVLVTSLEGVTPPRRGARSPMYAPAGVYRCAGDDEWIALTVVGDVDWMRVQGVVPGLDRPDWQSSLGRHRDHEEIDRVLASWCSSRPKHSAMDLLQRAGLSGAAVMSNADLVEDPHLAARGFFVPLAHRAAAERVYPGIPLVVDGRRIEVQPAPPLGSDNESILDGLDFSRSDVDRLMADGAVGDRPPR